MTQVLKNIEYIKWLKEVLRTDLPGWNAQSRLLPNRPKPNWEWVEKQKPKVSAVLLLLYPREEGWHIVFTKRHNYKGVHANQISFPGGKLERGEGFREAALRETEEELGLNREKPELLGSLSKIYIPPSNFIVHPQVGFVDHTPKFIAEEREVKEIIEVPVSYFHSLEKAEEVELLVRGEKMKVPAFKPFGEIIWGATAMILSEFIALHEADKKA